jgi:hypothetical protein
MDEVARSLIEAQEKARALFAEVVGDRFGLRRHWHKRIARAGKNTMLTYLLTVDGPAQA